MNKIPSKTTIFLILILLTISVVAIINIANNKPQQDTIIEKETTKINNPSVDKLSSTDRAKYIRYCTDEGIDQGACVCRVNAFDVILAKEPTAKYMYLTEAQEQEMDKLMYKCDPQTGEIIQ